MSKKVRNIIIAASVLAAIVLATVLLSIVSKNKKEKENASSGSSVSSQSYNDNIAVFSFEEEQVRDVHIKNSSNEYTIKYKKDGSHVLEGKEGFERNEDTYNALISACSQFSALKLIAENASDLSPYGLDKPIAEVSVTYDTGEQLSFDIGDVASSGGYYVYFKSNDKVYLADSSWTGVFTYSFSSYVDMTMIDAAETDEEGNEIDPDVRKISYTGRGVKNPIVIEKNPDYEADYKKYQNASSGQTYKQTVKYAEFIFTSPFKADVSDDAFGTKQFELLGLTAYDIKSLDPTAAELKECGLDNPYVVIDYVLKKKSYRLLLGNTVKIDDTTYYYAIVEGKKAIYIVDSASLEFYKEDLINYISAIVVNELIDNIKTLTIEHGGQSYKFELTGSGDNLSVRWNGKKMSTAEFRDLYQLIMLVYCEESVDPGKYKGDSDFVLTYTYNNKSRVDKVEYVKADVRKYLIRLNGSDLALVRSKYVDMLSYGLVEFINGRNVPSDY